jgi:hypothetical protein
MGREHMIADTATFLNKKDPLAVGQSNVPAITAGSGRYVPLYWNQVPSSI